MRCPGCGSSLWNGEKCPACGRLATDTTPRAGHHPPPAVAARQAIFAGAVGGAIVGFLGGGPLELDKLGNAMLIAAGLGALIGGIFAAWLTFSTAERTWAFWPYVPAIALGAALLVACKETLDWLLGQLIAQQAKGFAAVALGAALGALIAAASAYGMAWYRLRASQSR